MHVKRLSSRLKMVLYHFAAWLWAYAEAYGRQMIEAAKVRSKIPVPSVLGHGFQFLTDHQLSEKDKRTGFSWGFSWGFFFSFESPTESTDMEPKNWFQVSHPSYCGNLAQKEYHIVSHFDSASNLPKTCRTNCTKITTSATRILLFFFALMLIHAGAHGAPRSLAQGATFCLGCFLFCLKGCRMGKKR